MLPARSTTEAYLYMELNPCECREHRFQRATELVERDGVLCTVYSGACMACQSPREFVFRLPKTPPDLSGFPVVFGGEEPSAIIDPGQYLAVAVDRAKRVPADKSKLAGDQLEVARDTLCYAIAAMTEVLKFARHGSDSVPADAFTSDAGRAMYAKEPRRFVTGRLSAVLNAYRDGLARMG